MEQLDRVMYRRSHMLCVRAPQGLLPPVSVMALSQGLLLVGHLNLDHDRVADDGSDYVTWYVTPVEQEPLRQKHAPDDARAEADPAVVVRGFNTLLALFPSLREEVERVDSPVRFTVYAGYKQDIGEHPALPVCERVAGVNNMILALPSVTTNAWMNARTAISILEGQIRGSGRRVVVPGGGQGVQVGVVNELTPEVEWMGWGSLVDRYPGIGR